MEVPKYLQVLWGYKWLLLFGLIVSVLAGLLAGFTIRDGELEPRVQSTYSAATTIMLSSQNPDYFQTEVLPDAVDPTVAVDPTAQAQDEPVQVNLSDSALIYAYLVSSVQIRELVEAKIGPMSDDEQILGLARTSQPGELPATTGTTRLSLPLIDVTGVATSPARAEEISAAADDAFLAYVSARQDAQSIAPELRVQLTTLSTPKSDEGVGANPWIPVAVAFLGTMFAFIALAFLLFAGQKTANLNRERKRRRRAGLNADTPAPQEPEEPTVGRRRADQAAGVTAPGEAAVAGTENDGAENAGGDVVQGAADGVEPEPARQA